MIYRRTLPSDACAQLGQRLRTARTADELRRTLCIWLRLMLQLKPDEIALAIGWTTGSVRQLHSRFLRSGEQALATRAPRRGGRRQALLSLEEEAELVRVFVKYARYAGSIDVARFRSAFERKAGHPVATSTIYRVLARHGAGPWLPRRQRQSRVDNGNAWKPPFQRQVLPGTTV
jgi:hypothetical protein